MELNARRVRHNDSGAFIAPRDARATMAMIHTRGEQEHEKSDQCDHSGIQQWHVNEIIPIVIDR